MIQARIAAAAILAFSVSAQAQLLRFETPNAWHLEEDMNFHIPDPESGKMIAPTTESLFEYRVERLLADGTAIVAVKLLKLSVGTTPENIKAVSDAPKAEQLALIASDGRVYGLYDPKNSDIKNLKGLDSWLKAHAESPWVWYKLPLQKIELGAKITQHFARETWKIERKPDESLMGSRCEVYESQLSEGQSKVVETTFLDVQQGVVVKRKISEKRPDDVAANFAQRRIP